jgi:hypothetical protein
MAAINVNSVEYAKTLAVPIDFLAPHERGGKKKIHKTTYTTVGSTFEAGSTITGTPFPKGSRIVRGWIAAEALGTSVTLKVSIAGADILAATSFASAAIAQIPDAAGAVSAGILDDVGGYSPVITSAGATAAASKKIVLVLEFVNN